MIIGLPLAMSGITDGGRFAPQNVIGAEVFGMETLGFRDFALPPFSYGMNRAWDQWAFSADSGTYKGMSWTDIHVSAGTFHWDIFDKYVSDFSGQGREMVYTFGAKPSWVTNDLDQWANFVTAVVTRAAGKIKYWELWNEPNSVGSSNERTGAQIKALAEVAYPIIKSIMPTAVVLSPCPQGNGSGWFGDFLTAGGKPYFDVMAIHLYSDPDPAEVATGGGLLAILDTYDTLRTTWGLSGKPLWCTEFSEHGYWYQGDGVSRAADERDYIGQMYPMMLSRGLKRLVWYAWGGQTVTGELRSGVGAGLNVAGVAWQEMRAWLLGATIDGPVTFNGNVGEVSIRRPGGYRGKIVWHFKSTSSYTIPAGVYTRYRSLDATSTAIAGGATSVTIANTAILIETGAP